MYVCNQNESIQFLFDMPKWNRKWMINHHYVIISFLADKFGNLFCLFVGWIETYLPPLFCCWYFFFSTKFLFSVSLECIINHGIFLYWLVAYRPYIRIKVLFRCILFNGQSTLDIGQFSFISFIIWLNWLFTYICLN